MKSSVLRKVYPNTRENEHIQTYYTSVRRKQTIQGLNFQYNGEIFSELDEDVLDDLLSAIETLDDEMIQSASSKLHLKLPRDLLKRSMKRRYPEKEDAFFDEALDQSFMKFKTSVLEISSQLSRRFAKFPILRDVIMRTGRGSRSTELCIDKSFVLLAKYPSKGFERVYKMLTETGDVPIAKKSSAMIKH